MKRKTHPWCHVTLWSRSHVMSRWKLKTKHIFLHCVCDQQDWQDGDLEWEEPIHNVTWPSDHVATWGQQQIKFGKVVTYDKVNSPIMSGDPLITDYVIAWGHVTNWRLNISFFAKSITTKHGRLVTYSERNPPWNHMIFWQHTNVWLRDRLKAHNTLFGKVNGHKTWQVGGLWCGEHTHEVTCPSDHLLTWCHVVN